MSSAGERPPAPPFAPDLELIGYMEGPGYLERRRRRRAAERRRRDEDVSADVPGRRPRAPDHVSGADRISTR